MNTHLGEIAALVTAVSWTAAAIIMEQATHRSGVMAVNTLKVAFGTIYLAILAVIMNAQIFPLDLSPHVWLLVGGSGLIGFVIGDYFLLHAYALIGARLGMLLLSISVPLTAVAAWLIFGEQLGSWAIAGIVATTFGIALTVMVGRNPGAVSGRSPGNYRKGVTFGILSAIAMAAATLLTKAGAQGIDSISATQVRILSALIGFIVFAIFTRKTPEINQALRNGKSMGLIALGGIFGPFVGVGCLLFALQNAEAGIVSTLSSLTPVLIIAPSIFIFKKRVSIPEIIGACIAMGGVSLLFL